MPEWVELVVLVEQLAGSRVEEVLTHLHTRVQQLITRRDTLLQELQHIIDIIHRQVRVNRWVSQKTGQ